MDKGLDTKAEQVRRALRLLARDDFRVVERDDRRPWGFFLSVDEDEAGPFIERFFGEVDLTGIDMSLPLRPKILGIAPHQRLSWQWHRRRSEVWRCLSGPLEIVLSPDDGEGSPKPLRPGESVTIPQGARHRGIGGADWALIAEIWQHVDPEHPSNEDDVVRVQDDFNRR